MPRSHVQLCRNDVLILPFIGRASPHNFEPLHRDLHRTIWPVLQRYSRNFVLSSPKIFQNQNINSKKKISQGREKKNHGSKNRPETILIGTLAEPPRARSGAPAPAGVRAPSARRARPLASGPACRAKLMTRPPLGLLGSLCPLGSLVFLQRNSSTPPPVPSRPVYFLVASRPVCSSISDTAILSHTYVHVHIYIYIR